MSQYLLLSLALVTGFVFLGGSYRIGRDGRRRNMFFHSLRTGVIGGAIISVLLIIALTAYYFLIEP